jgi:hypothetical protein
VDPDGRRTTRGCLCEEDLCKETLLSPLLFMVASQGARGTIASSPEPSPERGPGFGTTTTWHTPTGRPLTKESAWPSLPNGKERGPASPSKGNTGTQTYSAKAKTGLDECDKTSFPTSSKKVDDWDWSKVDLGPLGGEDWFRGVPDLSCCPPPPDSNLLEPQWLAGGGGSSRRETSLTIVREAPNAETLASSHCPCSLLILGLKVVS